MSVELARAWVQEVRARAEDRVQIQIHEAIVRVAYEGIGYELSCVFDFVPEFVRVQQHRHDKVTWLPSQNWTRTTLLEYAEPDLVAHLWALLNEHLGEYWFAGRAEQEVRG